MSGWVLGLTGGIGSGKTAASDWFAQQGLIVVDADVVAREVVQPQQPAWRAIRDRYGADALLDNGQLNRPWLRAKVFADAAERLWLEQQTHPAIRDAIVQQLQRAQSLYAVLVSPLLFESQQVQLVQRVLVIDVDETTQLQRASARDGNDEEQIKRIIQAQMPRAERCARADDVVNNEGDLAHLQQQLHALHTRYVPLAQPSSRT